jgi:hypothetical protein
MAAVLKTVDRKVRGFESCSLRQKYRPAGPGRHMRKNEERGEMAEWPKAIAC